MKRYSHENWNQVLALPDGPDKDEQLEAIGSMAKGNLQWFIRQCIATDEDIQLGIDNPRWDWPLIEPTEFTKRRRKAEHEDTIC
jgi:hypothetical protein